MNSDLESYLDWISLYDSEVNSIWLKEEKELRKISMLYFFINKEFDKIKSGLGKKIQDLKIEVKKKNLNETEKSHKLKEMPSINNENTPKKVKIPETPLNSTSPSLNKFNRLKNYKKLKLDLSKKFNESLENSDPDIIDSSIIEGTPHVYLFKNPKSSIKKKPVKKQHQTTLTQIFDNTENMNQPKKTKNVQESMEIDDLLDLINETESNKSNQVGNKFEIDSDYNDKTCDNLDYPGKIDNLDVNTKQEISKEFNISKGFIQNYDKLPIKKKVEPTKPVRGKERLKLPGWSCRECENFYKNLNLSPDELKKKMNECSRHRSKQQRDETFSGFWDLSLLPSQKNQKEPDASQTSLIFNFKK